MTNRKQKFVAFGLSLFTFSMIGLCAAIPEKEKTPEEQAAQNTESLISARETEAQFACRAVVNETAKYKHETKYPWLLPNYLESDGISYVKGNVKLMNSYGAMITHIFACAYQITNEEIGELIYFEINEA